jgi:hypothetical protein
MSGNEQHREKKVWIIAIPAILSLLAACADDDSTPASAAEAPETTESTTELTSAPDTTEPKTDTTEVMSELPPCDDDCPELLLALDPHELPVSPVLGDPSRVKVGFFLGVGADPPQPAVDAESTGRQITDAIDTTNQQLEVCDIAVELEAAGVLALPPSLLQIKANEPGSYGGHPPRGIDNVEQFNYDQNETLTPETRKLFEFGKAFTSANAIAAFTVAHIEYYAEGSDVPSGASGLSFPPNSFHRPEDYPSRNSLLLATTYSSTNQLPSGFGKLVAHELGHMLLNRGDHPIGRGEDGAFSAEECVVMQQNLTELYGERQVIDPGRPED